MRCKHLVLKRLLPDLYVQSIYEIDLLALQQAGVKGIITDLDNTLIEWDRPVATAEVAEWLEKVQEHFKIVIVSNNNEQRVSAFSEPLTLPYIYRARKPLQLSFQKALDLMNLPPNEVVVIGDQLFTDVLGGNRLNLYTILVTPVAQTDGFWTRFNRRMERIALQSMRKRGLITWQDPKGR
jgi:HAD superfamily phosphatase (TIGR01668 family)